MGKPHNTGNLVNAIAQDSSNNIGIGGAANASFKLQVTGSVNLAGNVTTTGAQFVQNGFYLTNTNAGTTAGYTNLWGATDGIFFGLRNGTGGGKFIFQSATSYDYTFPAATGTLALTSNLSAYLPLTGGTLTGALSGTSATFSSTVRPASNLGSDLGTSSFRWAEMWGYTLNLNGGTTVQPRITIARGSDDTNQNMLLGFNNITLQRLNVPLASGQTDFSIVQQGSDGSRTPFNISSTATATFQTTGNNGIINIGGSTFYSQLETNSTLGGLKIKSIWGGANSGIIQFINGTAENVRMHIADNGNVGIGTTDTFGTKLRVEGGELRVTTTNLGVAMYRTGSIGEIAAYDWGGGAFVPLSYQASEHRFGIAGTERMRITSGGNVCIGLTASNLRLGVRGADTGSSNFTFYADNGASQLFSVRNDGVINTGSASGSPYNRTTGSAGNLFVDFDGSLYRGTASSQRFKENITDWNASGLDTILALKPKTFTYKEDYYSQPERQFLGLIAEEVAEVSPYLADFKNEDGTGDVENVRYANIVVPLIKAIQELKAEIEQLKQK